MRKMVEKLLSQYGTEVTIEGRTVRGLLQPMTGKLERLAQLQPGPLGTESRQRYIYIGPLEPELGQDAVLTGADKTLIVRSAHEIWGNDGPCYRWAMCVEKGREEPWASSCCALSSLC